LSHHLKLNTLYCIRAEDNSSTDQCRLVVLVDGKTESDIKFSLSTGQTKQLGNTYIFSDNVTVTLWDRDFFDPDDARPVGIGPVPKTDESVWYYKTSPQSIWRATISAYTGSGWAYLLTYDVTKITPPSATDSTPGTPPRAPL
jgi:hypothetical protein